MSKRHRIGSNTFSSAPSIVAWDCKRDAPEIKVKVQNYCLMLGMQYIFINTKTSSMSSIRIFFVPATIIPGSFTVS